MAAERIHVEIVTPERAVLETTADEVVLPGAEGQIGVLPGHLPLLTALGIGEMFVVNAGSRRRFFVDGGFAEVLPDRISVLTEACEGFDEIDVVAARQELEAAEARLAELEGAASETVEIDVIQRHQDALKRARMRLVTAGEEKE